MFNYILRKLIERERRRQVKLGYDYDHDSNSEEEYHLIKEAIRYSARGRYIQALALLTANEDLRRPWNSKTPGYFKH